MEKISYYVLKMFSISSIGFGIQVFRNSYGFSYRISRIIEVSDLKVYTS